MKNEIKKLFVVTVAAVSVLCIGAATCFAAPSLTAKRNADGTTTVKVITDTKDPNYLLYILRPDTAPEEMVKADGTLQGLHKLEQIKVGSPVNTEYDLYTYSFSKESTDPLGEYRVIVVGEDLDAEDKAAQTRFVMPTTEDETNALTAVAAAPTEATLQAYQSKAWYVDFDNDIYKANKSEVLASFAQICESPTCGGDVQQAFETACILTELKYAPSSKVYQLLYAYEHNFGLTYCTEIKSKDAGFLKSFEDLRADANTNPARTTAELNKLLRNAEGLSRINAAKRETVVEDIRVFEDVFGLKETLNGVDDYEVAKEILATDEKQYTSVAQVVDAVKEALKTPTVTEPTPAPQGEGGSGGSVSIKGKDYTDSATQETIEKISPAEEEFSGFLDLQGAEWAEGYIEYMNYAGIMTGDGNGSFRPLAPITREEFAKALLSALKITGDDVIEEKPMAFNDVNADAWYYETVKTAYQTGIINGIDESSFGVGHPITRQDAATMVTRARYAAKLAFRKMADAVEFADNGEIAGYALSAVTELQKAGVLSGYEDGAFKPQNSITRAETAKLIYGLLDGLGKL